MKRSVRLFDFLSTQSLCSTIRLLLLLTLVCIEVTSAQTFVGGIRGTITDPSSTVNFVRLGLNRVTAEQVQALSAINPLAADLSYGFLPGRDMGQITIAGLTTYPGGPSAEGDYLFHYTSYQANDSLTLTKGNHSIRAGVAMERIQSNTLGAGNNNGVVSFGSLQSFLINQPSSFQATLPGTNVPESLRQEVIGTYLQDDRRARHNLAINLDLSNELATASSEQHDRLGTLLPKQWNRSNNSKVLQTDSSKRVSLSLNEAETAPEARGFKDKCAVSILGR